MYSGRLPVRHQPCRKSRTSCFGRGRWRSAALHERICSGMNGSGLACWSRRGVCHGHSVFRRSLPRLDRGWVRCAETRQMQGTWERIPIFYLNASAFKPQGGEAVSATLSSHAGIRRRLCGVSCHCSAFTADHSHDVHQDGGNIRPDRRNTVRPRVRSARRRLGLYHRGRRGTAWRPARDLRAGRLASTSSGWRSDCFSDS